ncbi:MAG: hypothetical protein ACYCOU_10855 [Sulfobacillus sp.]
MDDPAILFRRDRLDQVWPNAEETPSEKYNAIVRLGIYVGILLAVTSGKISWLVLPLLLALSTIVLFNLNESYQGNSSSAGLGISKESLECRSCRSATPKEGRSDETGQNSDSDFDRKTSFESSTEADSLPSKSRPSVFGFPSQNADDPLDRLESRVDPGILVEDNREKFMDWCWNSRYVTKDGDLAPHGHIGGDVLP